MKRHPVLIALLALLIIGIVISYLIRPDAETGKDASEFMAMLFSESESLADAPFPKITEFVANGKKKTLTEADLNHLHAIFSQGMFIERGTDPVRGRPDDIAELRLTYAGGRLSFPIYRIRGSNTYRLEAFAGYVNCVFMFKDETSQFEEFLRK